MSEIRVDVQAAMEEKRAQEEARHQEIVAQNRGLKEGYNQDCQDAFAKAKDELTDIW